MAAAPTALVAGAQGVSSGVVVAVCVACTPVEATSRT
jgi:hypothetical protein